MEQEIYFVAISYPSAYLMPTIVERFDSITDANSYAHLMSRTKNRIYVVLKQKIIWDCTSQEK